MISATASMVLLYSGSDAAALVCGLSLGTEDAECEVGCSYHGDDSVNVGADRVCLVGNGVGISGGRCCGQVFV